MAYTLTYAASSGISGTLTMTIPNNFFLLSSTTAGYGNGFPPTGIWSAGGVPSSVGAIALSGDGQVQDGSTVYTQSSQGYLAFSPGSTGWQAVPALDQLYSEAGASGSVTDWGVGPNGGIYVAYPIVYTGGSSGTPPILVGYYDPSTGLTYGLPATAIGNTAGYFYNASLVAGAAEWNNTIYFTAETTSPWNGGQWYEFDSMAWQPLTGSLKILASGGYAWTPTGGITSGFAYPTAIAVSPTTGTVFQATDTMASSRPFNHYSGATQIVGADYSFDPASSTMVELNPLEQINPATLAAIGSGPGPGASNVWLSPQGAVAVVSTSSSVADVYWDPTNAGTWQNLGAAPAASGVWVSIY